MSGAGMRTTVVAVLAAAVAVRVSVPQAGTGTAGRIAHDPSLALAGASDGWSLAGGLGGATAQGLRDLPVACFLWLTDILRLPPAAGETAWWVLVQVIAVLGAVQAARAVTPGQGRVGEPAAEPGESWAPWVAAALYACGPVLLATTARSLTDGLVVALLPWVVAPLLRRDTGWRGAAKSAWWLGLAGVGSPGWAIAAFLSGALAALPRSRSGLAQFGRWLLLAALASAWWIGVLAWEARYAVDLSDLVAPESAEEGVREVLGAAAWGLPWVLVTLLGPVAVVVAALVLRVACDRVLVGGLLAASALTALLWRDVDDVIPVLGPGAVTTATGVWGPLLAGVWLAALVAWRPLVEQVWPRLPGFEGEDWSSASAGVAMASAALLLVPLIGPLLAAREPTIPPEAVDRDLWAEVSAWSETAPPGRVLVLPATEGRWASVVTGALGDRPWVGRDSLPVSGAAATGALDDLLWRLSRGQGGPATAAALERLGIAYVLLRNDVSGKVDRERPAALVRHALAEQGASRVAVLEPAAAGEQAVAGASLEDFGIRSAQGGVEIWALPSAADGWVYEGQPLTLAGDAGSVADLAGAGVAGSRPVRVVPPGSEEVDVVSDSARRRDIDQRVAIDPFGPTLTDEEDRRLVPPEAGPTPTAARRITGAAAVTASSSAADLGSPSRDLGADPIAAVDGNAFTSWLSRPGSVTGEWWEITFEEPTDLTAGTVQLVQSAFASHRVTRVRVATDAGAADLAVPADGVVALGSVGTSSRLRIQATSVEGTAGEQASFGIVELRVPDVVVRDHLAVAPSPTGSWLLSARPGSYANCVPPYPRGTDDPGTTFTSCDRSVGVPGPDAGALSRVLRVDTETSVAGRVWVRAADTETAGRLADTLGRPSITATGSSVASQDLISRPQAAVDADPATAWRPSPEDEVPVLELSWRRPREVTGLRLVQPESGVASQVTQLEVIANGAGGAPIPVDVAADGSVSLPPIRAKGMTLRFVADTALTSVDTLTGGVRHVPIALAEVEVRGGPTVRYDQDTAERLPCGAGPKVTVAGEAIDTTVTASARSVVEADALLGTLCSRPTLPAGETQVAVESSFSWLPLGLVLAPLDGPMGAVDITVPGPGPTPVSAGILSLGTGNLTVDLGSEDSDTERMLAVAVPASSGWTATGGADELTPVTVDGWAQAWLVPAGIERVDLTYSAGASLRLLAGLAALGWLVVVLLTLLSRARRDHAMTGRSTHA